MYGGDWLPLFQTQAAKREVMNRHPFFRFLETKCKYLKIRVRPRFSERNGVFRLIGVVLVVKQEKGFSIRDLEEMPKELEEFIRAIEER